LLRPEPFYIIFRLKLLDFQLSAQTHPDSAERGDVPIISGFSTFCFFLQTFVHLGGFGSLRETGLQTEQSACRHVVHSTGIFDSQLAGIRSNYLLKTTGSKVRTETCTLALRF
jgi:hypothetical protein